MSSGFYVLLVQLGSLHRTSNHVLYLIPGCHLLIRLIIIVQVLSITEL